MAVRMGAMVLLVTVLAMGTPFVFAHRDLLQFGGIPGVNPSEAVIAGQTLTLVDVPGLKITSHTEPLNVGMLDLTAILSGNASPPTITISDRIEGTWLNPVTFTSTTTLDTNILPILFSKLPGFSNLQGLPISGFPTSGLPTTGFPTSIPISGLPTSGLPTTGFPTSGLPFMGTVHASADDDIDIDVPDVEISSKPSTTVHMWIPDFNFTGFNIPNLPKLPFPFPFPFSAPAPSPPRASASSPNSSPSPSPSPSSPSSPSSSPSSSPPPRRHEVSSPSYPRSSRAHSPKSSDADSPKSSHKQRGN